MYQVFISYRRSGGEFLGKMLHDRLTAMGFNVFYDVEGLNAGPFNTQLLDVIRECSDFLLVLSPGAMDRCAEPDDWVRREISCALGLGKNIVPVMMRDFEWPDNLPAALRALPSYEALTANNEYFDALLERLARKFLKARPLRAPAGAAPRYAVTAVNRMTKTVQVMVDYLAGQNIDPALLREYACLAERLSRGAPASDPGCWQNAFALVQQHVPQSVRQSLAVLQSLNTWILQQGDRQRAEILSFFRAYCALWYLYDGVTGQPYCGAPRDTLTCGGNTYEICDVLAGRNPDERFLCCARQGAALLPELCWFVSDAACAIRPLTAQEDTLITGLTVDYATGWRLFDPMPLWMVQQLGEREMQYFPQDGSFRRQLQIQKLFRPQIAGQFEVRRRFSRTTVRLLLRLDSVYEAQPDGKPTALTPFAAQIPLDIVDATPHAAAPDTISLVLTCPRGAQSERYFLRNAPKVYRVTVSRGSGSLVCDEVTDPRQLAAGAGVRFALRLAVYRMMGVIG